MFSKKLTALAAGALLVASTSAVAQTVPASAAPLAGAAMIQSGDDGEGIGTTTAVAIGFILIVAAILIATAGGGDGDSDDGGSPVSP